MPYQVQPHVTVWPQVTDCESSTGRSMHNIPVGSVTKVSVPLRRLKLANAPKTIIIAANARAGFLPRLSSRRCLFMSNICAVGFHSFQLRVTRSTKNTILSFGVSLCRDKRVFRLPMLDADARTSDQRFWVGSISSLR